ncbi:MAG TPA: MarR family winged helix-turn-helix transcriptional regulator [Solirubrobacteraceae bacterium]|nr:MarR family winged helix-turn-helix transcriptional regulator [Solirubrobacteraceae bacterium]
MLAEHDLKPRQLRILDLLADRGPIGQPELAELVDIDHSALVNLLNPLETGRLSKRERDTVDRRRHVVTIAAAGQRRLALADQAFRDAEAAFFSPLTAAEREQLHSLLLRLRDPPGRQRTPADGEAGAGEPRPAWSPRASPQNDEGTAAHAWGDGAWVLRRAGDRRASMMRQRADPSASGLDGRRK